MGPSASPGAARAELDRDPLRSEADRGAAGTDGARTVTAQLGKPYNYRTGPDGKRGFDVNFFRIIDYGGGRVDRQRFLTRYDG